MDLARGGRAKRGSGRGVANKRLSDPGMLLRRRTGISERFRVRAREMRVPSGSVAHAAKAMATSLPVARIGLVLCLVLFASVGILLGVTAFAKSREISVRIENGPIKVKVVTTARTVKELLDENHMRVGPNDEVTPVMNTKLTDGMTVVVNRAIIIFITSRKEAKPPIYMTGGTVEDALMKAQISFDQDDEISPPLDTMLTPGMRIKHVAKEVAYLTELQNLKFKTIYENTRDLLKGKTQLMQSGKQGVQQKTIEVVYKDGEEISREVVEDIRLRDPVNRIVLKGTGTPPKPTAGNSGNNGGNSGNNNGGNSGNNSGNSGSNGGYSGLYGHVKPDDLVIPSVPVTFIEIRHMQLTAYTHTGRKTACGTWPQYTRTREKPGTIAVDKNAIPYGTLLYVTGYGYCVAEDTGSNKVDSSRMGDLFMNTRDECYQWGRRRDVVVYIVEQNFKRAKEYK